jgi:hypothetical protein
MFSCDFCIASSLGLHLRSREAAAIRRAGGTSLPATLVPGSPVGNNATQGVDCGSYSLPPWLSSCSLQAPKKRKVLSRVTALPSSSSLDALLIPQLYPATSVGNESAASTSVLLLANESAALTASAAASSWFESDELFSASPLHPGPRVLR